jgi:hypothetical protein
MPKHHGFGDPEIQYWISSASMTCEDSSARAAGDAERGDANSTRCPPRPVTKKAQYPSLMLMTTCRLLDAHVGWPNRWTHGIWPVHCCLGNPRGCVGTPAPTDSRANVPQELRTLISCCLYSTESFYVMLRFRCADKVSSPGVPDSATVKLATMTLRLYHYSTKGASRSELARSQVCPLSALAATCLFPPLAVKWRGRYPWQ